MKRLPAAVYVPAVLVAAILACVVAASRPAHAEEARKVVEIRFKGNREYDESTLEYSIRTKEGNRFSESRLAEDEATLLTFFERVTTKIENVQGGVRITFLVEENPVVSLVAFRGFSDIEDTELRGIVFTKEGYPFSDIKVQRDRKNLVDRLKKDGRYFAEVRVRTGVSERGRQVVFTAIEGPEVEVDEILFVGNDSFDEGDLEDRMVLDESTILDDTPFVERTLEQDLISLAGFYRSEGYLDAVVELRDLSFSRDKDEVTITIGIEEGEPYLVESFEIRGAEKLAPDPDVVRFAAGDHRREEDLFLTARAIRTLYLENAYANVSVRFDTEDDSLTHRTRVVFTIKEGDPVRIRRLEIIGNTLTRDDVIRRNVSVRAGGPLNTVEIRKSLSRLEALNYFERETLGWETLDTDDPGLKDLVFRLDEGRTGSIRFSAGVSSDLGFLGVVELEKRNFDYADLPGSVSEVFEGRAFTGGGQTLDILVAPGTSYSQYRIAFTEPWFLADYLFYGPSGDVEESPYSLGFDVYRTIFSRFEYDEARVGVELSTSKVWRTVGNRLDDVVRARLTGAIENVKVDDFGDDAPPTAYRSSGVNQVAKTTLDLRWRHVDFAASPGEGFEADFEYTLGGGPLDREVSFHRVELGVRTFLTLYTTKMEQRHILTLSGRMGMVEGFGDTDEVPIFERYFGGGSGTVRGFEYGQVGPRASGDPDTAAGQAQIADTQARGRGDPTGGERLWMARAEYSFPLIEDYLRGVVFSDAGNVANDWGDKFFEDYRASVGFGFRLRIPFLGPTPLALDFAWPVKKERGDRLQVFSFTFDRPF